MNVLITYQTPTIESPCDYVDQWEIACDFRDMICVACSLCVSVRVCVVLYSSGDCGAVTMLVGTRSSRSSSRTEYVAVLMMVVVRVRARRRRWSRLLDWKERRY